MSRQLSIVRPRWCLASICLALLLVLPTAPVASAAYVQQVACDGVDTPYNMGGLEASIDETPTGTRVHLDIYGIYQSSRPDTLTFLPGPVVATIAVSSLAGHRSQDLDLPVASGAPASMRQPDYHLSYDIDARPIGDYFTEIRLRNKDDNTLLACSYTVVTPMLPTPLSAAAQWLPPAALALVLLASIASRAGDGPRGPRPPASRHEELLSAHTSRIADCLAYIQLLFFLGSLTLHFPGFMRPITSLSSWSTLMFPGGPITGDSLYQGVADGIYEVNGTFGGTTGLELVSQITGAPATEWNWINIVSLACMLLASLMLIFQLGPAIPWTRRAFDSRVIREIRGTETSGVQSTIYTVLRLFFSYFMTPMATWTSYQLMNADLLPIHHIIISAVVLALIPAAIWWGLRQKTPRQFGYFLVDDLYKQGEGVSDGREKDMFALALFVFMYLRGCALGGLQMSGFVQLLALGGCEMLQLVVTACLRRTPLLRSGASLMCGLRLLLWLLCFGFLPGIAGPAQRSVLGLVMLCLLLAVLAIAFVGPSVLGLVLWGMRVARKESRNDQRFSLESLSPAPTGDGGQGGTATTEASWVQLWLERVNPADRASLVSVADSVSTTTTLVDRPRSVGRPQSGASDRIIHVHAISPRLPVDGAQSPPERNAPVWNQLPNFSRPLSTLFEASGRIDAVGGEVTEGRGHVSGEGRRDSGRAAAR